jgi:hypothetical protein
MRRRLFAVSALVCAASLAAPHSARAQAVANLERQLLPLQEGALKGAPGVDATLWESLAFLRTEEDRQRAVKGSVTFGLTGDESGPRSLFKLNTGVSLSRGNFPTEITVDTLLGLQMVNGQLQEDVTSLKISYDYHTTSSLEYFAFAERFSDNFLSIQQRYEVGFGARIGLEIGRVGNWRETDRQFENLRRNLPGVRAVAAVLPPASVARLQATRLLEPMRVDTALSNLEHMVRDEQTKLFIGLAASVFAEIENAAIDVLTKLNADPGAPAVKAKIDLDGTHRYRLNIRPTFRLRPSRQIQLRVYPYWKLPLDGAHHVTLPNGERRFDYRRDVLSEMTWSIRPEDTGVETVDFVFTFNHFFDNVPPSVPVTLLDEAASAGRTFDRLIAEERHRFVSMALRIRW